jgi:hypothetical protein
VFLLRVDSDFVAERRKVEAFSEEYRELGNR